MKLAIFKNIEFGYEAAHGEGLEGCEEYVRTTEYVDVEFAPLENKDIVIKQVNSLKEIKKKIQAETELKLSDIDNKIGELLALTHME